MNAHEIIQASADDAGVMSRDVLAPLRDALGPGCLKPRPRASLNGCVPCHVMSRVNGATLTGPAYPHPKQAMIAYADNGPFAPLPDGTGWASLDNRAVIILEDERWSAKLEAECQP